MNNSNKSITVSYWFAPAFMAVIIAFVVLVRMQFIHIPFERDEGTYCYFGQLLLDGKIPYLDFYEMKPPVLFYSYAAVIFLFGKTIEAVHIAFIVLNIFTIIFLYFAGKKLLGKSGGLVTAASYAVLSLSPFISGFTVQSEHIISFFVSAGLWVVLQGFEKKKLFYFFSAGVLLGASALIKQNGIFFIAFTGIIIIIYSLLQKPANWKHLMKCLACFAAGVSLVLLTVISVLYYQGALQEAYFWTWKYAQGYVSTRTVSDGLGSLKTIFNDPVRGAFASITIAAILIILPTLALNKKIPLFSRIFVLLFLLFSFLAVTPGLRFYGHYFIFFVPAVSLLIAVGVTTVKNILSKFIAEYKAEWVSLSVFSIIILLNIISQRNYYFNHNDTDLLQTIYGGNPFPEAKVIGDYIKKNSTDKDCISVFGSESEIYFYANRRCPSKYSDCTALLSANPRAQQFQKEYKRDMENSVPKYFIVFNHPSAWPEAGADTSIYSWLNSFLAVNYRRVCVVDMLSDTSTRYVWGSEAIHYKMQSSKNGSVFERMDKTTLVYSKSADSETHAFETKQIFHAGF